MLQQSRDSQRPTERKEALNMPLLVSIEPLVGNDDVAMNNEKKVTTEESGEAQGLCGGRSGRAHTTGDSDTTTLVGWGRVGDRKRGRATGEKSPKRTEAKAPRTNRRVRQTGNSTRRQKELSESFPST